ncbi:MAG: Hpt domain-containing protein [Spirochaetaceae bacterium]|jgi:HPt (histidine-containing phosphotransfer) domain-containing protein|nr:Hpt domain-containing protein [Spirochaetaceae bacterium]
MEDKRMADNGIIYVDIEEGRKRVMGNTKLYIKLLNKFKADPNLEALLAAVEKTDYEKAQGLVHTIKGIAANLSLTELYKQSVEFETQIKNREVKPGVPESFKTCFEETIKNVDKVIVQYG